MSEENPKNEDPKKESTSEEQKFLLVDRETFQRQGEIVVDLLTRVAAIEQVLIEKNIVTEQEFFQVLEKLNVNLLKAIEENSKLKQEQGL